MGRVGWDGEPKPSPAPALLPGVLRQGGRRWLWWPFCGTSWLKGSRVAFKDFLQNKQSYFCFAFGSFPSRFPNLLGLLKRPGRIFWLSFVRQGHFDRYQNASAAAKIRSVNEQRPPRSWSPAQHWDFGTGRRCLSWALALTGCPCPSSKLWSS